MHNLISWYNQNTIKAWFGIAAIIIFLLLFFRIRSIETNKETNIRQDIVSNVEEKNEFNSISISDNYSAITGQKAETTNEEIEVIDKFVSFCNSGNIQEAYKLISNECKEQLYKNINDFQDAYYKPVFAGGKRNVSIENWKDKTYIVNLNEDALATGRYSAENSLQDYFTIVNDAEGNVKLNINGYIGRTNYDKVQKQETLEVRLLRKDTFMDYEIYTFKAKNNSGDLALLGRVQDENNVSYLVDKNDLKYNAYVHEIPQSMLELLGYQEKTFQIKYFSEQSSSKQIVRLVFPKVYLHYETYNNYDDKTNFVGLVELNFDL